MVGFNLEDRILQIGDPIVRRAQANLPVFGTHDYRRNKIFEICMADSDVQSGFFRFVDVLPSLRTKAEISKHFSEYLDGTNFAMLAGGAGLLGRGGIDVFAKRMASDFIAGKNMPEAYQTLEDLRKKNMSFTLDILGEKTTSNSDASAYQEKYIRTLEFLGEKHGINSMDEFGNPVINLSVKVSSLYARFDPIDPEGTCKAVKDMLRPILLKAQRIGAAVNIDAEQYQYRDITYRIFRELMEEEQFKDYKHAGIVVQTYLQDSENALKGMLKWAKDTSTAMTVRLAKGAYWDYETMLAQRNNWKAPVFGQKWQSDANFEKLTDILLKNSGDGIKAAIASHNIRSISNAIALKEKYGILNKDFEIQMLHGMGGEIKKALIDLGYALRIYTPVGELVPGMAYFVRRLLENSANESFLRALSKNADPNDLLAKPAPFNLYEVRQSRVARFVSYAAHFGRKRQDVQLDYLPESKFRNFPVYDFSKEAHRNAVKDALKLVQGNFGKYNYDLQINGRSVDTGVYNEVFDPSTGRQIGRVSMARKQDVDAALKASKVAFEEWRYTAAQKRAEVLWDVARQMSERVYELSALAVYEAGKTLKEAYADIAEAIDFLNFYGHEMIKLDGEHKTQQTLGEENTTSYVPKGTVAVISPWNFPMAITCGMTAAALVTGNTVVLKPASDTPLIAGELYKMFEKAGLPNGVLNYLPGSGKEIGDYLSDSPLVDHIAFTGSREIGVRINQRVAMSNRKIMMRPTLEMGGKDGLIIDSTADLEAAVLDTLQSAFGYQGQKCSACSRVIVLESVYEAFKRKLINGAQSLKVGKAEDPGTDVGPIINEVAYNKIKDYVGKAVKGGGKVLLDDIINGDNTPDKNGCYMSPTLVEVDRDNIIAKEEVFGPVLSVIKVKDFDEAIEVLNDTDYALTAGLHSRTPSHIREFKKRARIGNRYINRGITGAIVERQPFGGYKMSGAGSKAGGRNYLQKEFMYEESTAENTATKGYVQGIAAYVKAHPDMFVNPN